MTWKLELALFLILNKTKSLEDELEPNVGDLISISSQEKKTSLSDFYEYIKNLKVFIHKLENLI